MAIKTIPDLTAVDTLADEDLLVAHDSSADATRRTTVGAVRSGRATTDALAAEVAARETHEAASNPHSGSASTADLATVGAVVTTHIARTDNPHDVTAAQAGAISATAGAATPYVSAASETAAGISELSTLAEAVTGTDAARVVTVAAARQAQVSLIRDSLGKFPGIIPPSLNLFCGEATDDTAPAGTFTRSTTGTRLGQAGLIETVAAGSVRREWDAGGVLRGWRIEELRTNLITYSEQFDNAAWEKYNTTVSANEGVAPDGNTTADKIIEGSGLSTHIVRHNVSVVSGSKYAFSIFARASERSKFRIDGPDAYVGASNFADFDLSNGTYTAYGNVSVNIQEICTGIYRCSVTFTAIETGSAAFSIWLLDDSFNSSYSGDGTSGLYAWGIQLEMAASPSSYIPTTSAAVARSADVWTVTLGTSWFNATAGTVFVAGRTSIGAPAVNQKLFSISDGTSNNRIYIVRASTRAMYCAIAAAGTTFANLSIGTVADATAFRVAFSWSAAGASASLNGAPCVTDAAVTLPSGLTTCRIGADASGVSQWGGHVLHVAYFPVALSDTQLQAITL